MAGWDGTGTWDDYEYDFRPTAEDIYNYAQSFGEDVVLYVHRYRYAAGTDPLVYRMFIWGNPASSPAIDVWLRGLNIPQTFYQIGVKLVSNINGDVYPCLAWDASVVNKVGSGTELYPLFDIYRFDDNTDVQRFTYSHTYEPPIVTTNAATNVISTGATLNGTANVGAVYTLTERGFAYGTSTSPTIYNSTRVPSGSGTGNFDEDITDLLPNTTYYVRAYAKYYDDSGNFQVFYGDEVNFSTGILYGRLKYHNGAEWVLYPRPLLGTTNQITVTDNLNTTYTLSTPQDIHTGATPTFVSLLLSGLTASRLVATDGTKTLESIADLTAWIAGTDGNLTVTDDGDGTVTLKSIGSIVNVTTLTDTDTLTVAQQGVIKCNKASAMTVNLPTAVGNTGLSYFISNVNTGTVTIDLIGFDLYQDESLSIVSDGANWIVR